MTFKPLLYLLKQPLVWLKGIIAQKQPTTKIQQKPCAKVKNLLEPIQPNRSMIYFTYLFSIMSLILNGLVYYNQQSQNQSLQMHLEQSLKHYFYSIDSLKQIYTVQLN